MFFFTRPRWRTFFIVEHKVLIERDANIFFHFNINKQRTFRLSNDDFRKIMMTPRSDAAPAAFKAPEPVAKKEKKKRDWKPRAPKEPREDPLAGYRDRAAERRAGDDQEAPDIASLTAEVLASRAEDPEKAKADLELEREIAKHTDHGAIASAAAAAASRKKKTALDYSVLAQIRAEIEQEQEAKEKEEKERVAVARKKEKEQKTTTQGPQTELGRIVARALTEKKTRAEVISPYRKVLQYSLSGDAGHDMPVVTVLNKDDVHIEVCFVLLIIDVGMRYLTFSLSLSFSLLV